MKPREPWEKAAIDAAWDRVEDGVMASWRRRIARRRAWRCVRRNLVSILIVAAAIVTAFTFDFDTFLRRLH